LKRHGCCCQNKTVCDLNSHKLQPIKPLLATLCKFPALGNSELFVRRYERMGYYLGVNIHTDTSNKYYSILHYHPIIRHLINANNGVIPKTISRFLAVKIGLPLSESVNPDDIRSDYFCLPNYSFSEMNEETECIILKNNLMDLAIFQFHNQIIDNDDDDDDDVEEKIDDNQLNTRRSSISSANSTQAFRSNAETEKLLRYEEMQHNDLFYFMNHHVLIELSRLQQEIKEITPQRKETLGLSRITIVSREYHLDHPDISKGILSGVHATFAELLVFLQCCFPEVNFTASYVETSRSLTTLHKILIFLLKVYGGMEIAAIGGIMGVTSNYTRRCLNQISPYMGIIGRSLHILDCTKEIFESDLPFEYKTYYEKHGDIVGFLIDGKCFPAENFRTSSVLMKLSYSNKTNSPAFLLNVTTTTTGLAIESTLPCLAKATEETHVREHGAIIEGTPLKGENRYNHITYKECPNIINKKSQRDQYVSQRHIASHSASAMDIEEEFVGENIFEIEQDIDDEEQATDEANDEIVAEIERILQSRKLTDDTISIVGRREYDRRNIDDDDEFIDDDNEDVELNENVELEEEQDDSYNIDEASEENSNDMDVDINIPLTKAQILNKKFDQYLDVSERNNPRHATTTSTTSRLSNIENNCISENKKLMDIFGPNLNSYTKMQQLQLHKRLNIAFQSNRMNRFNLLAHRIYKLQDVNEQLMEGIINGGEYQFRLPTRYLKLDASLCCIADRGYIKHSVFYPNLNKHITPSSLKKREQFDYEDQERDIDIKRLRYSSETYFARVVNCRLLGRIIKIEDFGIFEDALSWAMAMANMYKPLREPGDWEEYRNI
jgi:hypothetical protein